MKADDVAQALKSTIQSGTEASSAVESLIAFLKRKGALRLLPRVLYAYERIMAQAVQKKTTLIVAHEDEASTAFASHPSLSKNDTRIVVDTTLIGGYIVRTSDTRHDASHKGALLKLYHNITSESRGE